MKKNLKITLLSSIIAVVLSLFGGSVLAEGYEIFEYYIENDQVTICRYTDETVTGTIRIPSEIEGVSVTKIECGAFSGCSGLTEIIIPDSVRYIGEGAFWGCEGLESISLPFVGESRNAKGSRKAVFGYIFGYGSLSYDRSYYGLDARQCFNSNDGIEVFTLPYYLKTVKITDATQIPYGAFSGCSNIENISINDGVSVIGDRAFADCDSLLELEIKAKNARFPRSMDVFENSNLVVVHGYEDSTVYAYIWDYTDVEFEVIGENGLMSVDGDSIVRGDDVIIALTFEKYISNGEVICSFYDCDDRLVKTVFVPVIRTTDTIYVTAPDSAEVAYAKVMTRDSMDSLEPATLATVVDILR